MLTALFFYSVRVCTFQYFNSYFMLFVVPVCGIFLILYIAYSGVYYLNVSFSVLITSGEDRAVFYNRLLIILSFLFGGDSSWFLE